MAGKRGTGNLILGLVYLKQGYSQVFRDNILRHFLFGMSGYCVN